MIAAAVLQAPDKPKSDAALVADDAMGLIDVVRNRIAGYGRLVALARGCLEDDSVSWEVRGKAALAVLLSESEL